MCQSVLLMFSLFFMLGLSSVTDAGESPCASQCWDAGGGSCGLPQPGKVRWCPALHLHSFSGLMDSSFLTHL